MVCPYCGHSGDVWAQDAVMRTNGAGYFCPHCHQHFIIERWLGRTIRDEPSTSAGEATMSDSVWVADDEDVGSEIYDDGRMFWRVQNMETDEKIYCQSLEMAKRTAKALDMLRYVEERQHEARLLNDTYNT